MFRRRFVTLLFAAFVSSSLTACTNTPDETTKDPAATRDSADEHVAKTSAAFSTEVLPFLPAVVSAPLRAIELSNGTIHVFARANGYTYRTYSSPTQSWVMWQTVNPSNRYSTIASDAVSVSVNRDGRLELFETEGTGLVSYRENSPNGTWARGYSFGEFGAASLAPLSDGRLLAVSTSYFNATTTGSFAWQVEGSASWLPWPNFTLIQEVSQGYTGRPAIVQNADGTLTAFVHYACIGNNWCDGQSTNQGNKYQSFDLNSYGDGMSTGRVLPGNPVTSDLAVANGSDLVFGRGNAIVGTSIYATYLAASPRRGMPPYYVPWQLLTNPSGVNFTTDPVAITNLNKTTEVFAIGRGTSAAYLYSSRDFDTWQVLTSVPVGTLQPTVIKHATGRLDLYYAIGGAVVRLTQSNPGTWAY